MLIYYSQIKIYNFEVASNNESIRYHDLEIISLFYDLRALLQYNLFRMSLNYYKMMEIVLINRVELIMNQYHMLPAHLQTI